jgi:hypothetical protein
VEGKLFKFFFKEGISVLRLYESCRGIVHFVSFGRVSVHWLLATMEAPQVAKGLKEFLKSSIVSSKAYIVQCCSNNYG